LLAIEIVGLHRLPQFKQDVFLPIPAQALHQFGFAGFNPPVAQGRQTRRIALPVQDGAYDRLPGNPAEVADGIVQLDVHLGQRLLHLLHRAPRLLDLLIPQAPHGAHAADFFPRQKATAQQTIGVQLQQPLALLYVTLASRQILRPPRIDQVDVETASLQHVIHGHPVHARGLHHHTFRPTGLQPVSHSFQVCCPRTEFSYRVLILPRRHRHIMAFIPDVDSGRVGMNDLPSRIRRVETMGHFSPLATIQRLPLLQPLESRFFALRHGILSS
jgi:hypothetical protein